MVVVLRGEVPSPATQGMEALPVLPQDIPLGAMGGLDPALDEEVEVASYLH